MLRKDKKHFCNKQKYYSRLYNTPKNKSIVQILVKNLVKVLVHIDRADKTLITLSFFKPPIRQIQKPKWFKKIQMQHNTVTVL